MFDLLIWCSIPHVIQSMHKRFKCVRTFNKSTCYINLYKRVKYSCVHFHLHLLYFTLGLLYMCGNFMNPCQQISTILLKHLLHRNHYNFLSLIWKLLSFLQSIKNDVLSDTFWVTLDWNDEQFHSVKAPRTRSRVCPECERNRPAFCRETVMNAVLWFWTAAEVNSKSISTGSYEMRHGSRAPMEEGLVRVVNISNQWHTFY